MTTLHFGFATDPGLVRSNNEDCYLIAYPLFAVADGMGGHAAGEVASAKAVETLRDAFTEHTLAGLETAAQTANRAVWEEAHASPDLRGMGTTLVALALIGEGDDERLAIANVGDSRIYRLHQGELAQLTSDHSLVGQMVASGALTPEEAEIHPRRNILTRALGVDPDVAIDVEAFEVTDGDRYLLCSDGLCRELTDGQMAAIMRRLADPSEAARVLVAEAKEHGGNDNITVVVIDVGELAPRVADELDKEPAEPTAALDLIEVAATPVPPRPTSQQRSGARPMARWLSLRVVAFILAILAIVAIALGGVAYYARGSYFVGLQGSQIVIFKGRPGGILWFDPTVAARPHVTTRQVLPVHLPELRAGKVTSSLNDARAYVRNLHRQFLAAHTANTVPSTTVPTLPATTVPTLPPRPKPTVRPGTTTIPGPTTVPRTAPGATTVPAARTTPTTATSPPATVPGSPTPTTAATTATTKP